MMFLFNMKEAIKNVEFQQILPKIGYICICRHSQVFSSSVVSAILTHINLYDKDHLKVEIACFCTSFPPSLALSSVRS